MSDSIPTWSRVTGQRKMLLVATVALAIFVTSLNAQIVAVAAPRLVADLGGFSLFSWVFTSFMLAAVVVIPIVGKLSDTFGRRPFMLGGLVVFVAASFGCALAISMPMLVTIRAVQGLGAGAVTASMQATIADLFAPAERGKYTAIFFTGGSIAQMVGPSLGGVVTDSLGWRWCFLITAPPAAAAFCLVVAYVPRRLGIRPPLRLDILGTALLTVATVALLLGLAWANREFGWTAPGTIGLLATAAILFPLFVRQERRHPDPLLSLHLLKERNFTVAIVVIGLVQGAIQAATTYLPTFVQVALQSSATASGVIATPQALGAIAGSFAGGQLISRVPRWRLPILTFMGVMAAAAIGLATLGTGSEEWRISLCMGGAGLGAAAIQTMLGVVVLNAVPHQSVGIATAARGFTQQTGVVIAIAIMGVVLSSSYESAFREHLPERARTALPASVLADFDDPTFAIDDQHLLAARAEVAAAGQPAALIDDAVAAERQGVAVANRNVFLGIVAMLLIAAVVASFLRATALRGRIEPVDAATVALPASTQGSAPSG